MLRENSTVHTFFCLNPNFQQSHTEPGRFIPIPHMTHDIQYLYLEKQRKGFEKKRFLTISEVNFQGKGRNHSQNDTKRKETKRVQEKSPFDNFQGQFSRRRKEKEPKQYRNIQKRNNMKRNEHGSRKRPWWQFPRTKDPFRSKGKKNESTKGRKNRNEKIMKKLNGDKRGMIIFNPKKWWSKWKNMISSPWLVEMNITVSSQIIGANFIPIFSRHFGDVRKFVRPFIICATVKTQFMWWGHGIASQGPLSLHTVPAPFSPTRQNCC